MNFRLSDSSLFAKIENVKKLENRKTRKIEGKKSKKKMKT